MTLALTDSERRAVEATIRFANLGEIDTDAAVERCFRGIDVTGIRERHLLGDAISISFVEDYRDVHAVVRWRLERIANADSKSGRREAANEVAAEVAPDLEASVTTALVFKGGRVEVAYEFGSVAAVCAFGVALITDRTRGLTSRLQQCGACGKLHPNLDIKGRPQRFCSAAHKRQFDMLTGSQRVMKSRRKKQQARKP